MADPKDYWLDSDYEDDGDTRKWDFWAVHRETGERHALDVTPNRPNVPVEEWLLHCELDFPKRSEAGSIGPLYLGDLINIKRKREKENAHE